VETVLNVVFKFVPSACTVAMIATAMPAAMRPYSMAVAPYSSFTKAKQACSLDAPEPDVVTLHAMVSQEKLADFLMRHLDFSANGPKIREMRGWSRQGLFAERARINGSTLRFISLWTRSTSQSTVICS
jgi:hypothetical protein